MDQHPSRSAFTLIELLVVIAIIAVLASMLLPAVGMVRTSAQTITCASGMRQIAMAGFSYSADHEGLLPMTSVPGVYGSMWELTLGSYLDAVPDNATHTSQIQPNSIYWSCKAPATGGSGKIYEAIAGSVAPISMWTQYVSSGIGMNVYPGRSPSAYGMSAWGYNWHLRAVTNTSTRAFIGDSLSYDMAASNSGPYGCAVATYPDWLALGWKYWRTDPERHQGRMNIAFYDGHTQTVPAATAYLTMYDPASFQ